MRWRPVDPLWGLPRRGNRTDMSPPSFDDKEPIVEPSTHGDQPNELTGRALRQRIRQQELLAELGVLALQRTSFIGLLNHTARITAEGLEAEYCKVMEYIPAENRLLVRAGVGWEEGVVGSASVGADLASPAGYALRTGQPVISNHLENEQRFRTPELLVQHGIRRAMNVILQVTARRSACWKRTAHPKASLANATSLFCKAPRISSGWRSSSSSFNANCRPRLIVIKSCSKKSITGSRTVCRWFRPCFNSRLPRWATRRSVND